MLQSTFQPGLESVWIWVKGGDTVVMLVSSHDGFTSPLASCQRDWLIPDKCSNRHENGKKSQSFLCIRRNVLFYHKCEIWVFEQIQHSSKHERVNKYNWFAFCIAVSGLYRNSVSILFHLLYLFYLEIISFVFYHLKTVKLNLSIYLYLSIYTDQP